MLINNSIMEYHVEHSNIFQDLVDNEKNKKNREREKKFTKSVSYFGHWFEKLEHMATEAKDVP